MGEVSIFGGNVKLPDVGSLVDKAEESAQKGARGAAPNGAEYMNFSGKTGRMVVGADKRLVGPDELFLVNVMSFEDGWVCWKNNSPVAIRMENIYSDKAVAMPDTDEFGPFNANNGEGWRPSKAMVLRSLDTDSDVYWRIDSKSGVSVQAGIIADFAERAKSGQPSWPVVAFDVEEFVAQGKTNFKPVINYEYWLTSDQLELLANEDMTLDEIAASGTEEITNADKEEAIDVKPAPKKSSKTTTRRRRSL